MAESGRDTSLGLMLSIQVLEEQLSYDEALLKAHSGKAVGDFVLGLNTVAGGEYFHLADAEARLRSGDAQRAVEGRIPLLDLPPELQKADASQERAFLMKELEELDENLRNIQAQFEDDTRKIELLRAAERNKPAPPNPWLGGIVILGVTTVCCLLLLSAGKLLLISLVFFLAGVLLATAIFVNEINRYQRFLEKSKSETVARRQKMRDTEHRIAGMKKEVQGLRNRGEDFVQKCKALSPDDLGEIRASFSRLFPPATSE